MERKVSMIGRHLIRIKTMQTVYAYRRSENTEIGSFAKELNNSLSKSYDQYILILMLLVDLRRCAENKISLIQDRQIKNNDEWHRLERFAHNRVLVQLENNEDLTKIAESKKLSTDPYYEAFKKIYADIVSHESEFFEEYIVSDDTYQSDKSFVKFIITNIIGESELLFDTFEDNSIYWNDDIDNTISMVEKTIKLFDETNPQGGEIFPMFASAETQHFGDTLFRNTLDSWDEVHKIIDTHLTNWTIERVAEMDIIVLHMAITEMIHFPEIPILVSFNEYIELAKWYSTQKSGTFVNGVLFKVAETLKNEGKVAKKGRGLI